MADGYARLRISFFRNNVAGYKGGLALMLLTPTYLNRLFNLLHPTVHLLPKETDNNEI